ncbi:sensor histidine kinase [Thermodesulfobacteriota bacterium]
MANSAEYEQNSNRDAKSTMSDSRRLLLDETDQRLIERPAFSFRLQLAIGFLLLFFLSVAIIIGSMTVINRIQVKFYFFQDSERFLFEVEQARRWEKNYFLYGTNLADAVQSASKAKFLLTENLKSYQEMLPRQSKQIVENLDSYLSLLHELIQIELNDDKDKTSRIPEIEIVLRKNGAELVAVAASQVAKEQDSINEMLNLIQRLPIYALIVYLVIVIYVIHFLAQRFMKRLNFLIDSTQRIAKGDFSPIVPIRKTRDEITTVSVAINRMLQELDSRQTAMVESHKLKAIGTLTAGVAHELNNPINNIMLTAHTLLEEYKDVSEEDLLEMINDLINEADRSRSVVRNLLDFARESESVFEPLDLSVLLNETVKLVTNQVKVSGAEVSLGVQPNLPKIRGDRQKLKQVFLNLILNAVDAVEKDGKIKINVEKSASPGFLSVHVLDNGCGIPGHVIPYIFDPFYTGKEPGKGTGLGLSVSQGIVNMHGGRINVDSEVEKFTRFTVVLPSKEVPADIGS